MAINFFQRAFNGMGRKLKVGLVSGGFLAIATVVLWYPYKTHGIPEWKLQVFDIAGKLLANVQANQEWLDPLYEGMVDADYRNTDSNGIVVFPKRTLHNRLIFGPIRRAPSSHIFVCWQDQYAEVNWDGESSVPPAKLSLKKSSCPYG